MQTDINYYLLLPVVRLKVPDEVNEPEEMERPGLGALTRTDSEDSSSSSDEGKDEKKVGRGERVKNDGHGVL